MKKNLIWAAMPLIVLTILIYTSVFNALIPETTEKASFIQPVVENTVEEPKVLLTSSKSYSYSKSSEADIANDMIAYAETLIGSPYVYAGISPSGFDCSGFITHVFDRFGIEMPHSSDMQSDEGVYIDRTEARKGDLVIFTGTNLDIREPGHVGIVISSPGSDIEFIHSSSNGGVKISKVEGTRYNDRFLEIRRVL